MGGVALSQQVKKKIDYYILQSIQCNDLIKNENFTKCYDCANSNVNCEKNGINVHNYRLIDWRKKVYISY